jgi:hypothetical protein
MKASVIIEFFGFEKYGGLRFGKLLFLETPVP